MSISGFSSVFSAVALLLYPLTTALKVLRPLGEKQEKDPEKSSPKSQFVKEKVIVRERKKSQPDSHGGSFLTYSWSCFAHSYASLLTVP